MCIRDRRIGDVLTHVVQELTRSRSFRWRGAGIKMIRYVDRSFYVAKRCLRTSRTAKFKAARPTQVANIDVVLNPTTGLDDLAIAQVDRDVLNVWVGVAHVVE